MTPTAHWSATPAEASPPPPEPIEPAADHQPSETASETAGPADTEPLIRASQTGSAEAFAVLVSRHTPAVFNYLWRLTGNAHDAEDLTQDTFVKAWKGIQRFQAARAFVPWLFTIARRTALNHFRAQRPTEEFTPSMHLAVPGQEPDRLAERADEADRLWRHARRLKPRQHEALWLHYGEGFDVDTIAGIMRTSRIHVRVLLHRARHALRHRLENAGFTPSSDPSSAR